MSTIVIKTGGRAAESSALMAALALEIKSAKDSGDKVIFVHGGGAAVSGIQKQYNLEPRFVDGKRLTTEVEMDLVDMGLAGLMNKQLVRLFQKSGLKSCGISGCDGGMIVSSEARINGNGENRTGAVASVNTELMELLLAGITSPSYRR